MRICGGCTVRRQANLARSTPVAAQLLASEPTGSFEVIEQLRQAAAGAVRRGAPENAVTYLRRALREGADRDTRAGISFELATAARFATQPAVMLEHYRQAYELAMDPVLRNTAALELALILVIMGGWEEPIGLARDALSELGLQAQFHTEVHISGTKQRKFGRFMPYCSKRALVSASIPESLSASSVLSA
jgi:hypothetical protein